MSTSASTKRTQRAEHFSEVLDRLDPVERFSVRFIRSSFAIPAANRVLRWCQRFIGAPWIRWVTSRLVHLEGLDRLPTPSAGRAIIWSSNHRTFFDMYVANAYLYKLGYFERILFPVRAEFFYNTILGFFLNGLMSFWSMYPPIFRDRKRLSLNHTAFSELSQAISGGRSVGIHPEGTRNRDPDPYSFLPAQSGIGRLMHMANAPVVPFYINGLSNNFLKQILGNFTGKGEPLIIVFGDPIDLSDLLAEPPTGKTYKLIAERVMDKIVDLSIEEKEIRKKLPRTKNVVRESIAPPRNR